MTLAKDSIYDLINPPKTVMKQHFVDYFQWGDFPNYNWTYSSYSSAPVPTMDNGENGGLKLSTGSTSGGSVTLHMSDIDQFSPTGSVTIMVYKPNQTTNTRFFIGLGSPKANNANSSESYHSSSESFYCWRGASGSVSILPTDVALDTSFHTHKIENGSAQIHYSIDGILKTTAIVGTDTTSTIAMQPLADLYNQGVATDSSYNVTYFEAYNT